MTGLRSISRRDASVAAVGLVLGAAYLSIVVLATRDFYVDDAYIGFAYVRNLIAGHGFVFEPGERVEGVTNAGWLLLVAPLAAVVPAHLAGKGLGIAFAALTALGVAGLGCELARREPDRRVPLAGVGALLGLLVLSHFDYLYFALSGMEPGLLGALLVAGAWLALRGRSLLALAALGAVAFSVRPEAGAVFPLFVALALASRAISLRPALAAGLLFAAGVLAITLTRWLYFGDWLPNTFHAKPSAPGVLGANLLLFAIGRSTNVPFPFAGPLAAIALVAGFVRVRRVAPGAAAFLAAAVAAGLIFGCYSRSDWTRLGRYFAPYAPLAFVLLWNGMLETEQRVRAFALRRLGPDRARWRAGVASVTLAGVLIAAGVGAAARTLAPASTRTFPGYILTSATLVEPSRWLGRNLPHDAVVATRRIGALGYFSDLRLFDYTFGLAERDVARRVSRAGRHFDDPNDRELRDLWLARRPDYVLEDDHVIARVAAQSGGSREQFRIHGLSYRVVRRFTIGDGVTWTLAERIPTRN
jgi:hypothetical protein